MLCKFYTLILYIKKNIYYTICSIFSIQIKIGLKICIAENLSKSHRLLNRIKIHFI